MNLRYQFILILLTPVFIWLTIRHYINNKDPRYLWQRFFALHLPDTTHPVWFHCASVGEVMTLIPLIKLYHQKFPDQALLVTTATVTGASVSAGKIPFATHCYLPLDYRSNIKRFIKKTNPAKLVVMETEIWPNLFEVSASHFIPVEIINGRLSARTTESQSWFKKLFFTALSYVDKIYCRTPEDARLFHQLGASENQLEVTGNLKFSAEFNHADSEKNLINRPYVVAASTRDHEEKEIIEIWNKSSHDNLLLVIAPRHPERKDQILNEISALTHSIKVRSQKQEITEDTSVYLADTLGELPALFNHAEFVIMGGSFVRKGGHNILEPAQFSKAVLFGPSMENFAAEAALLTENNAALQAENNDSAIRFINRLTSDTDFREQLGKNARQIILENRNIAEDYLEKITQ